MTKSKEKLPYSRELTASVEKNGVYGTYLLLGEEEADKEDFVRLIRRKMPQDITVSRFHCSSDEFLTAVDQALSTDMFQPGKLVIIKEIDSVLKNKSNIQLLHDMVDTLPDANVLVLMTSANKMNAALSKISDKLQLAIFWKKFENELSPYISRTIQKGNKSITPDAVQLVLDFCGRDRYKIDEAVTTLLYGTKETSIERKTVQHLLSNTRDVNVFECVDVIFEGRKDSLSFCARAIDNGSYDLLLVSLIGRRLQQIEKYIELKRTKGSVDLLRDIGIQYRQQTLFEYSARRFSAEKVRLVYRTLYKTEKELKSGGAGKNILANPVSDLIYSIIT